MNRGLIWIAILVVLGVGGFLFKDFLSGNAGNLQVGQCFDLPSDQLETVDDVQHHPCDQVHGGEVFFVGKSVAANDAAYPSNAELQAEVFGFCDPAFTSYTGKDSNTDPEWTYGFFVPTSEGWGKGDRGIICYARKLDGSTTTTSIKSS